MTKDNTSEDEAKSTKVEGSPFQVYYHEFDKEMTKYAKKRSFDPTVWNSLDKTRVEVMSEALAEDLKLLREATMTQEDLDAKEELRKLAFEDK